jgi:N-acetylneuraminic acid mutarotase
VFELRQVAVVGLAVCCSASASASEWTQIAPMPQARWYHAAGIGSDGKLYVYGGYVEVNGRREPGRGQLATLSWDPTSRSWEAGPPAPRGRVIQRHRAPNELGTEKGFKETDYVHENPLEVELPSGRADPQGALFWLSGITWVRFVPTAGVWDAPFPPVWIKNPAWKPGSTVPGTLWIEHAPEFGRYSPSTATVGQKIYVTGGLAVGVSDSRPMVHASAEVFDASTGTWTSLPSMGQKRYLHATAETRDGKVCVFGGSAAEPSLKLDNALSREENDRVVAENIRRSETSLASVECYDPKTNAWSERKPLPTPRQAMGAALGADGKIYVVGGAPSYAHPKPMDVVEVYDPEADTWSPGPPLEYPRRGHAVVSTKEGRIYAIGGWVGPPKQTVLGKLFGPKVDRPLGATVEMLETKARP